MPEPSNTEAVVLFVCGKGHRHLGSLPPRACRFGGACGSVTFRRVEYVPAAASQPTVGEPGRGAQERLRRAVWALDLSDDYTVEQAKPRELISCKRPVEDWIELRAALASVSDSQAGAVAEGEELHLSREDAWALMETRRADKRVLSRTYGKLRRFLADSSENPDG